MLRLQYDPLTGNLMGEGRIRRDSAVGQTQESSVGLMC
jgi:hypothetical protein